MCRSADAEDSDTEIGYCNDELIYLAKIVIIIVKYRLTV